MKSGRFDEQKLDAIEASAKHLARHGVDPDSLATDHMKAIDGAISSAAVHLGPSHARAMVIVMLETMSEHFETLALLHNHFRDMYEMELVL